MRPSERDLRFIAHLADLMHGQARAALAGSLGKPPGAALQAVRWLAPWTRSLEGREFALHHLVAALYASHPAQATGGPSTGAGPAGNLGATMRHLARKRGRTPTLEQRFVALLEADAEEVGEHLRRVVSLAREADIPLDWAQLLTDVSYVKSIMATRSASFVRDGCLE